MSESGQERDNKQEKHCDLVRPLICQNHRPDHPRRRNGEFSERPRQQGLRIDLST